MRLFDRQENHISIEAFGESMSVLSKLKDLEEISFIAAEFLDPKCNIKFCEMMLTSQSTGDFDRECENQLKY